MKFKLDMKQTILIGIFVAIISYVILLEIIPDPSCQGTYSVGGIFPGSFSIPPTYQLYESGVFSWSFKTLRTDITLLNASIENTLYGPCSVPVENIKLPYRLPQKQLVHINSSGCAPEGYHRGDPYNMHITFILESDNGSIFTSEGGIQKTRCGLLDEKNNAVPLSDNL